MNGRISVFLKVWNIGGAPFFAGLNGGKGLVFSNDFFVFLKKDMPEGLNTYFDFFVWLLLSSLMFYPRKSGNSSTMNRLVLKPCLGLFKFICEHLPLISTI